MMKERSEMIKAVRSELVGPSILPSDPEVIEFSDCRFVDNVSFRQGPLVWHARPNGPLQEVLYYERESPHRKYGAGVLHPASLPPLSEDKAAAKARDLSGAEIGSDHPDEVMIEEGTAHQLEDPDKDNHDESQVASDDLDISGSDVRYPSTLGVSICISLPSEDSELVISLPQRRSFFWQTDSDPELELNGRYERCKRNWSDENGKDYEADIWRRLPAIASQTEISIPRSEFTANTVIKRKVSTPEGSPLSLELLIYPRKLPESADGWLTTVVLANRSDIRNHREATLYQSFFEVSINHGALVKYPESARAFKKMDSEEKSLFLLYQDSSTWGIGHGCAAGWDGEPGTTPESVYADVMPAVELPSMTPDIKFNGAPIKLSMRELAGISDDFSGEAWESIDQLVNGYDEWIKQQKRMSASLPRKLQKVAADNLSACDECLRRIHSGVALLRSDPIVREAFRLANLSMLLQQIATKQISRRPLELRNGLIQAGGDYQSPWSVFEAGLENTGKLGSWRAFQIAFLLMSLPGVSGRDNSDRELVDLIWFPTGGGKTEAYLGAMAFYMFHQRLLMRDPEDSCIRDGTNVLMRYTLRMLTTQQFQRAASLICAMEFLRRNAPRFNILEIPGRRFSLGLWIGREGSPNKKRDAKIELGKFRRKSEPNEGNPLVVTECPWCRASIGKYDGPKPRSIPEGRWNAMRVRGIIDDPDDGPLLHCPSNQCEFGQEQKESWLPIEVIDERLYDHPPSLVISTADKLAILAYRPKAGALFGRLRYGEEVEQDSLPPGLIIQDELHLISGPLGTMYALYEGAIERLCCYTDNGSLIRPKIIASTATIRGAAGQVLSLYDRQETRLFPSPALSMGDSFFGKYARDEAGRLDNGRLYLGIHASGYGSILTTQVRTFSAALFRPWQFGEDKRDPWWTLLAFYNSIRELGGARTLFDSDIRSRLKFLFNRENIDSTSRRNLQIVEELTSRLSQAGIVQMMDRLSTSYSDCRPGGRIDACLASNIIEVGVDIDRLSLMGVVGQPKTTATYIQVTGRVGRRWWERPGLILTLYSPAKSRDRSHFEQFHSYHRRLYEQVEPTTATPFAISSIERGLAGVLLTWARQHSNADVQNKAAYTNALDEIFQLLEQRCKSVQVPEDQVRSLTALKRMRDELLNKWSKNPQEWEAFPQQPEGEYLMLWPGQYAEGRQKKLGVTVPSSMRQVDSSAELTITQGYATQEES